MHNTNPASDMQLPRQRGFSLVLAVFVLALLTGVGLALLFLTRSEVKMGQASLRTKQAFYLAEAGLENARLTLFEVNRNHPFDDDLVAAAGANGVIDFDPAAIRPVYDSQDRVTGFTGYGDDVPLAPLAAFGDGWYIAFLTNDPDEPDPFQLNLADSNDRVMVTAVGAGPSHSVEVVQAILESTSLLPSMPPAAITLIGPTPYFDGGPSYAKEIIGNDCDGAGVPGLYVPTVGVTDPNALVDPCPVEEPSTDSVLCGVYKPTTYTAGPYTGTDTVADVTDPDVFGGAGPLDPAWSDCQFLHDLVDEVRELADVICPEGRMEDCPNLPPSDPSRIIFVDGDFFIDPWDGGEGFVLVTGKLELHGDTEWSGALFAIGEGIFWQYGSGQGAISGTVFVADIAGPDQIFETEDDCTGGDDGLMSPTCVIEGGGQGDNIFCTADFVPGLPPAPYDVVDFLQR